MGKEVSISNEKLSCGEEAEEIFKKILRSANSGKSIVLCRDESLMATDVNRALFLKAEILETYEEKSKIKKLLAADIINIWRRISVNRVR